MPSLPRMEGGPYGFPRLGIAEGAEILHQVADFLSPAELARWRDVVDTAIAQDLVRQPAGSNPKVYTERMNLRWVSATVKELVEGPRIGELVADLEGIDAVRICLDQALVKEPYSLPTRYHLDLPWWTFESDHACTIWVALDDATVENGCLHFVPGSHRGGPGGRLGRVHSIGLIEGGRGMPTGGRTRAYDRYALVYVWSGTGPLPRPQP
ncbi:MAG: phytanoyl-CoA dioxygenase family protein [Actinomycetota bacterium]|nr:phytanoyl-CoA dioxygenase family protein [Actinomycetota bacterium]